MHRKDVKTILQMCSIQSRRERKHDYDMEKQKMQEIQIELLEMKIKYIPDAINSRFDTAREKLS